MIKLDIKKGNIVLGGKKSVLITEICTAIGAVVEGCGKKEDKLETAALIYDVVTNPDSHLWEDTGVTLGAIKRHIANKERQKRGFEDFSNHIRSRFYGEI